MNRKLRLSLIIASSIVALYTILGFSGVLVVYRNSTWANEPSLKEGQFIVTTNLINPKPGDFVAYTFKYPDSLFSQHRIFRMVASEGDIVEMRDGTLFVNGENFDKDLSLAHEYRFSIEELNKLDLDNNYSYEHFFWMKPEDTLTRFIDDRIAEKFNLKQRRVIKSRNEYDDLIQAYYKQDWNRDHFGPFKIPKGKIFFLADNRDISEDSRFIGPIDRSSIKGVLIK